MQCYEYRWLSILYVPSPCTNLKSHKVFNTIIIPVNESHCKVPVVLATIGEDRALFFLALHM